MKKLLKNNSGATAIEYGVIAAMLSVVIIGALAAVGSETKQTFDTVGNKLESAFRPASGNTSETPAE